MNGLWSGERLSSFEDNGFLRERIFTGLFEIDAVFDNDLALLVTGSDSNLLVNEIYWNVFSVFLWWYKALSFNKGLLTRSLLSDYLLKAHFP